MARGADQRFGNSLLAATAGVASFLFSLAALIHLTSTDEKLVGAVALGVFALLVCWIAAERPNGRTARASAALADRLLRVRDGDFLSPAPPIVHAAMPAVGEAVDDLFAQVRDSIARVHAAALIDPITGLANRIGFCERAAAMLKTRPANMSCAMIFVDLDRFKAVNDNLGHARGDEALAIAAARLLAIAAGEAGEGSSPIVGRLAGDEFVLFFPRMHGAADAEWIARRAAAALARPFALRGHDYDIGASVGVAIGPDHGADLPTLMRASDAAMYAAKTAGRGGVRLFDDALAEAADVRAATQADLRRAIADGELELYFQPQVAPGSGEVQSVEALLRWRHPTDGLRLPPSFLPVAEECGLIVDLGDWTVDAVAETLGTWRRAGIATRLALNVSPRQLDRSHFFARLRAAVARTGAALAQLELEFTESASVALDAEALAELAALRRDGVLIALDDFGAGVSSFAQLGRMPLDRIKIDGSLVAGIAASASARMLVQATVQLVHALGCAAVAEGVESDAQAELLRVIGCDVLQGYALAEPMTGDALLGWMAARAPAADMRAITAA